MSQLNNAAIAHALLPFGWAALENSTAIACKTFNTAVGAKQAHVFVADFGEEGAAVMLQGEYQGEGRNILESQCMLLPKNSTLEEVKDIVAKFAQSAERAIEAFREESDPVNLESFARRHKQKRRWRAGRLTAV